MRSARAAALLALLWATVGAPPASAAPCRPDIIDLGTLAGGRSAALDIGPDGQIVGWATGEDGAPRAVVWIDRRIERLPVPSDSFALDINRHGIVGSYVVHEEAGEPERPFLYVDGRAETLPLLPGATSGVARRINARGQIAGWAVDAAGHEHAVVWTRDRIHDLGSPAGYTDSYALVLNDRGQVGGAVYNTETGAFTAYRWTRGRFELLPSLGGGGAGQVNVLDQRGRAAGLAAHLGSGCAASTPRTPGRPCTDEEPA
jgi:probable HAF family extracellular repeat protein